MASCPPSSRGGRLPAKSVNSYSGTLWQSVRCLRGQQPTMRTLVQFMLSGTGGAAGVNDLIGTTSIAVGHEPLWPTSRSEPSQLALRPMAAAWHRPTSPTLAPTQRTKGSVDPGPIVGGSPQDSLSRPLTMSGLGLPDPPSP